MQLTDICVSLELAQKLKEAGCPQESLFYWVKSSPWGAPEAEPYHIEGQDKIPFRDKKKIFSAPTASELGEQLPIELKSGRFSIERFDGFFEVRFYLNADQHEGLYDWHDEAYTEADARAKMWLYLKKQGLLTTV